MEVGIEGSGEARVLDGEIRDLKVGVEGRGEVQVWREAVGPMVPPGEGAVVLRHESGERRRRNEKQKTREFWLGFQAGEKGYC